MLMRVAHWLGALVMAWALWAHPAESVSAPIAPFMHHHNVGNTKTELQKCDELKRRESQRMAMTRKRGTAAPSRLSSRRACRGHKDGVEEVDSSVSAGVLLPHLGFYCDQQMGCGETVGSAVETLLGDSVAISIPVVPLSMHATPLVVWNPVDSQSLFINSEGGVRLQPYHGPVTQLYIPGAAGTTSRTTKSTMWDRLLNIGPLLLLLMEKLLGRT
jgi:hypothetical protein